MSTQVTVVECGLDVWLMPHHVLVDDRGAPATDAKELLAMNVDEAFAENVAEYVAKELKIHVEYDLSWLVSDEEADATEEQEARDNECSSCGLDLREAACRDYPECQEWID